MRLNRFFIDSKRVTRRTSIEIQKRKGFTLIEVLVSMALVGIAVLGLAQLFTYCILNNSRSEKMSTATFLAQQQIDSLRNLTVAELNLAAVGDIDEQIDINLDLTYDFRRITQVQASTYYWDVRVLVFSAEQIGTAQNDLIQNPSQYKVKANISTIISR